jgi:hypothetical protein
MAHYFFAVTNGKSTFKDEAGRTFSSLEDARAHAVVIAGELVADGPDYARFEVVVTDGQGHEYARVAVGQASG